MFPISFLIEAKTRCKAYGPIDDKVVRFGTPSLDVVRVLVWDIFWSETDGGVSGGE